MHEARAGEPWAAALERVARGKFVCARLALRCGCACTLPTLLHSRALPTRAMSASVCR